ncbi:alpha/beta hydrolase [Roseibium polysiphoniae]|uniref:Dienelactone hydrolase family protein n=1 Tax=Roseibium polysiphoniae TaxID=2571221 RepID=A0ABR9CFE0_9HYPH|nr:dienelactone hydrolase family protein [Roseibium polysiphoniae]MBD8878378.1 dienelactone hydrolase family protein [Roseibium polysiphoniae]
MTPVALNGPRLSPASGKPARQLVIILHGYGADGADLIDLGRAWSAVLPDAAFVAPDAPERLPSDMVGGRQWFALQERDLREYRIGAEASAPLLNAFIDAELNALGLSDNELAIVGFSQGAMLTLQVGLRRRHPPAALIAYSGLLPGADRLTDIQNQAPVLLIHGQDDDVVAPHHLDAASKALLGANIPVESHLLDDLGHTIDERGMVIAGRFLAKALGGLPPKELTSS